MKNYTIKELSSLPVFELQSLYNEVQDLICNFDPVLLIASKKQIYYYENLVELLHNIESILEFEEY